MKILVVVDMQNDFITGSLGTPEAQAIVPNVKKKIDDAVANGDIVVYTRDTHFENYLETKEGKKLPVEHCIQGTYGWRIPDELMVQPSYDNYKIYNKYTFGLHELPVWLDNSFRRFEEVTEIELVGLCTDICVVSNALLLKSYFYNVVDISVDATCCAGVTPETHEAALKTMEMCQINVRRG
jgi:nicotinamidase-related amidase